MFIYVVRAGDTLWQISARFTVSVPSLVAVNGLQYPDRLVIGQALIIPSADREHTVKAGESLWKIAEDYAVPMPSLVQANRLSDPDRIYPGQTLRIPPLTYQVQSGDTLSAVAQRFEVSLQRLISANRIANPDRVSPGAVLMIPPRAGPAIGVNGYIYLLGRQAVPIVEEGGQYLTYLAPFAYLIREDGTLQPIEDGPALEEAKRQKIVPMMSITNFTATSRGENLASAILSDAQIVEKLLEEILAVMRQKGYQGLNVDFESVLPEDREAYNRFLARAAARMHENGYFLSTAVAPKTYAGQPGLLYEAIDYPAHGSIADFVILMTYEWGYRKGPPQAVSPISEIQRVLNYAVTVIPRGKIYMGFQIYARDWLLPHVQGQEAETVSNQEAVARAVRYGAVIRYDEKAGSPWFRYTDNQGRQHEVWFEDARSAQAKFDAVRAYGLAGISYWALGYPYPQNWVLLEENFTVRKSAGQSA